MRNSGPFLLRLGLLTAALYLLAHLLGWSGLARLGLIKLEL